VSAQAQIRPETPGPGFPDSVVAHIFVGGDPTNVTALPNGEYLYVGNETVDYVTVVRLTDRTVLGMVPTGASPWELAASPSGDYVYTSNQSDNSVSVIGTADNTVVATIPVGRSPALLTFRPAGDFVYVSNNGASSVSVIRTSDNTVAATVPVGDVPRGITCLPNGEYVYVANRNSNSVSVIRTSDNVVVTAVPFSNAPHRVCATNDGSCVYVTMYGGNRVFVIRTSDNAVVDGFISGSSTVGMTMFPGTDYAYIVNSGENTVSVVQTFADSLIKKIPTGHAPWGVTAPAMGDFVYTADRYGQSVTVIGYRHQHDVCPVRILAPIGIVDSGAMVQPMVLVKNLGTAADVFPVTCRIGAGYSNTTSNTRSNLGASGASGFQVSGTVRQLVYDLNHTRDLVRQAAALERSANAALTRTQADLVLQVKLAFYRYLQAVELVGVAEADVRNRQEHVALTQARLNSGLGLPSDVVRAQTAYANAVYNLTVARAVALSTRVALAELMGIDPRTPFEPADSREPAIASPDLTALADLALRQRPEMAQARANIAAAAFGVSAAQTVNSPAVVGSVGVVNRGSDFPPGDRALTVGLSVEWTPVDSGLARGRVKEAQASLDLVQSQLAATRLAVIGDVAQAYVSLKAAEQRVTAAQAQVADAEESVRLTQGRYRAGIGVFMDVLDAQAALDTAKANLVNALSGVDQASAALWHAVGTVPQR